MELLFLFSRRKKIPTDKSDVALKGIITEKGPVLKI